MKRLYLISVIILMLAMLFLPLAAARGEEEKKLPAMGDSLPVIDSNDTNTIRVYRKENGKIEEMKVEDYIFCVVAAEMPALYEAEALKAQAVAAYTYALYKSKTSDADYDITDDSSIDQAFKTREQIREKWGEKADEYEAKIRDAIKSVSGQKIYYEGSPILSVYHAISSGQTENASEVWGGSYAYLTAVDSSWDKLSTDYLSTVQLTSEEFSKKLSQKVELKGDASAWVGEIKKSSSGSVLSIALGGKTVSGGDIRSALELRSSNFDISFADGKFTLTVRGYGHGIGMSQNGANYLAQQGKSYKEILTHYYKDCSVQ